MAKTAKPDAPAKPDEAPRLKKTEELAALEAAGKPLAPLFADADRDDGTSSQPKFGTARAAGPGPVPRVCHPLERATRDARRFKCWSDVEGVGRTATKYVLAPDGGAAAKLYAEKFKVPDPKLVTVLELGD